MYTIQMRDGRTIDKNSRLCPESLFDRAKVYAWIQPDQWQPGGYSLFEGDEFDKRYFGLDTLRIETGRPVISTLAVKVTVTGHKAVRYDTKGQPGYRCRIEFCGDGEPSTYTGGIVYFRQ